MISWRASPGVHRARQRQRRDRLGRMRHQLGEVGHPHEVGNDRLAVSDLHQPATPVPPHEPLLFDARPAGASVPPGEVDRRRRPPPAPPASTTPPATPRPVWPSPCCRRRRWRGPREPPPGRRRRSAPAGRGWMPNRRLRSPPTAGCPTAVGGDGPLEVRDRPVEVAGRPGGETQEALGRPQADDSQRRHDGKIGERGQQFVGLTATAALPRSPPLRRWPPCRPAMCWNAAAPAKPRAQPAQPGPRRSWWPAPAMAAAVARKPNSASTRVFDAADLLGGLEDLGVAALDPAKGHRVPR